MFVERAAEHERIDTLLALTRAGSGRALVVRGGPGIGKTAAEEQPLLCLIDDAHWLDAASSDAFVFLARRLEADSVARGATNKDSAAQLFLSPTTIEKHLGSSDSKLGLRSRAELARIFAAKEPAAADVAARA